MSGNILKSLFNTCLKKNELHSSILSSKQKIDISKNSEVLYITDYNNTYYIVIFDE